MGVLTPAQAKRRSTKRALTDNCCPSFLHLGMTQGCGFWLFRVYLGIGFRFYLGLQVVDLTIY